jgi:hypothetical protein
VGGEVATRSTAGAYCCVGVLRSESLDAQNPPSWRCPEIAWGNAHGRTLERPQSRATERRVSAFGTGAARRGESSAPVGRWATHARSGLTCTD